MKSHVQVAIVGGGIMGVSALYHLTKLGWHEVALLEKHELTAGSTWHAAGLCTHFAHNPTIMELRAHSVRLYKEQLTAETGMPVSFHPVGALRVTRSRERMSEFLQVQSLGRFTGYDFDVISPRELTELYPLARVEGLLGAIYEPNDGHVDPSQATQAMAAAARRNGATIYRKTPVESIEATNDGHWRLHTREGTLHAEIVVNAAGTWCREVGAMLGLDLPVVPMLHQYLVTDRIEAVAALGRELPIIRDPEESWYLRQERDGLIVGPYEKDAQPWSVDDVPAQFGMELLPPDLERVEHIVAAAMRRVPALAEGGIKSIVNGPITFTPDANPLIGPAFALANVWLLTGSSMGVMEGGGAGRFLAEWIVAGEPPMDALALDPRRFGDYADRDYRVAKASECFALQFGIHYPYEERPAGRPRRTSAVDARLREAGAVMGCANGWERANYYARNAGEAQPTLTFGRSNWFDAVAEECLRVSDAVGVSDMSPLSKFEVRGADAARWLGGLGANRVPAATGSIALLHVLTPSGGIASEFTVTRLGVDHFYLTSAAGAECHDHDLLRTCAQDLEVAIDNRTQALGVLAVMGPKAPALLAALGGGDLSVATFPWLTARRVEVGGVPARALRLSYIGESGFELHVPMQRLSELYDALLEQGGRDLVHYGAFAMNAMRLEKGYRAWGLDIGTERTPLEAGLARFVRSNGRSFVGRKRLLAREAKGPWRMALLELEDTGTDAFGLHAVLQRGEVAGLTTSGSFGHRTRRSLALAYFRDGLPARNDELTVLLLGEPVPARVLDEPPYDAANRRMTG